MPRKCWALVEEFRATTPNRAFILNALAVALATTLGIEAKRYFESKEYEMIAEWKKAAMVLLIIFTTTFLTYHFMRLLFCFGGGMLVNDD